MLLTEFSSHVSADVAAPATQVFTALTDVQRLPEWNARIAHVIEPLSGTMELGSVWVIKMKIPSPPASWPSRATCTAYDPDALVFSHRSMTDDGNPSFVEWRWQVVPVDATGSRLDVTWSVNPRTFWRRLLFARMRRPQLVNEVSASLRALEQHLAHDGRTLA